MKPTNRQLISLFLLNLPGRPYSMREVARLMHHRHTTISRWQQKYYHLSLEAICTILLKVGEYVKPQIRYMDGAMLEYVAGKQQIQSFMREKYDHSNL